MRLIFPGDWSSRPWTNGVGVTHEMARGGGEPWSHRLSVAEVASDGPFSRFDGVDRQIMLLSGAGFTLHGPGWTERLDRRHLPFAFAGEEAVDCALVGGPCRDFNVMTRRAGARAEVEILKLAAGLATIRAAPLAHYLLALDGLVRVRGQGGEALLEPVTCAVLEGGSEVVTIEPTGGPATVASIGIAPAPRT
jgi:environmental stress-induced protein Ves